ncbi:MAG TPA: phosphate ABC transporter substrate-binding protein PstS [Bryobacteraceae bacterium]|nr:phosphate ABC transporter substrate-binding protein PstS [Bryobacteraceae bacterium]
MKRLEVLLPAIAVLVATIPAGSAQRLNAAGASFPSPIYQKWFGEWHNMHSGVEINYAPQGSGAGIKQLTEGTVDFAASDMPMKDAQIAALKVKAFHFPTVLGAVVLTYNIPGVNTTLKFSPQVIAGIFLGTIKKWNDRALMADNPGVKFPNDEIVPVHRSDASGTNFVFTDYLCKISPEFKRKVGADTKVRWPVEGLNGNQNPGVTGLVRETPDSIGYIELTFAVQNKMPYAEIKNAAGNWIKPTNESVTAAAASAKMPPDFRVSITDAPGKDAYPISTFTYMLIPSKFADPAKAKVVKEFLQWMLTDGQKQVAALDYAPLPKEVVDKELKQLAMVK